MHIRCGVEKVLSSVRVIVRFLSFSILQFVNFLMSKRNSLFKDESATIYQDMDRPLSHYWIASSHNT